MNTSRTRARKHWYFITVFYCPICAGDRTYRERRYTKRPRDYNQRHEFKEVWDYCGAL